MCLYRFIRSILVGDLPINSFFRLEPKNPAVRVNFFTKKLLTDVLICCIIGRLKLYKRGNYVNVSRLSPSKRAPENRPNFLGFTLYTKGFLLL